MSEPACEIDFVCRKQQKLPALVVRTARAGQDHCTGPQEGVKFCFAAAPGTGW